MASLTQAPQVILDRWKRQVRGAVFLVALAAASAMAAAVMLGFLSAALFLFTLGLYGVIIACLIEAGLFLFAALVLLGLYAVLAARLGRKDRRMKAAAVR